MPGRLIRRVELIDKPAFSPLDGIRVVEMSHMIFGPSCGMFLAFSGAEVIKVEPPHGDRTRVLTGMGESFFPTFNRGKKSVVLDLTAADGIRALEELLVTADVFVENFRESPFSTLGLDVEGLRRRNPGLIIISCKGFLRGPYEDRPALDEVVQMMTGLAYMTGPKGRPLRVGSSANDIMGGLFGAYAVMGALREREETGRGRDVRIGLFENSLLLVAQHMVQYELSGMEPPPMPDREFSWPVYDIFDTADGKEIFVGAVTGGQWEALCRLLDLDDLLADPTLQDKVSQIGARNRTIPRFRDSIAGWRFEALAEALQARGLPFAPVARPAEMYSDPQACSGRMPVSRLPSGREIRAPGLPLEVDGDRIEAGTDIPAKGADSTRVLESLGLDPGSVLRAMGQEAGCG